MKMKKYLYSLCATIAILGASVSFSMAQEMTSKCNKNMPNQEVATFKVKANSHVQQDDSNDSEVQYSLISDVNELAEGDDILTEMIVAEIYKTRKTKVYQVVKDMNFDSLPDETKRKSIKESEIISIINNIKN